MKKKILLIMVTWAISTLILAQAPPAPPSNPTQGGNGPVGGSAPLDGGITLLVLMGVAYSLKKTINTHKMNS